MPPVGELGHEDVHALDTDVIPIHFVNPNVASHGSLNIQEDTERTEIRYCSAIRWPSNQQGGGRWSDGGCTARSGNKESLWPDSCTSRSGRQNDATRGYR